MRERLFRGKRKYDGEWVEGYHYKAKYYRDDTEVYDFITIPNPEEKGKPSYHIMVISETVGQYIGREDIHGKKAFEGDIVKHDGGMFYISYFAPHMAYYFIGLHGRGDRNGFVMTDRSFEIIGNIHDNPELLEVQE